MDEASTPRSARSAARRQAILAAARSVFLRQGFASTTMDQVAVAASASKQTMYRHFRDKEALFAAVVSAEVDDAELGTHELVRALGDSDDLPADLRAFARRHVRDVIQPHLVRLRRVVLAEAERFPGLARHWWEEGPGRGHATLAEQLSRLDRRGLLRVPDPDLAAQHLNWLVLSIPLNAAMFGLPGPTGVELDRVADEAVRVFLAGYAA